MASAAVAAVAPYSALVSTSREGERRVCVSAIRPMTHHSAAASRSAFFAGSRRLNVRSAASTSRRTGHATRHAAKPNGIVCGLEVAEKPDATNEEIEEDKGEVDGLDLTTSKMSKKKYRKELVHLQHELVKMAEWVKYNNKKVCIIFEGRDAAGKGGMIKTIMEPLNHRVARVVALTAPTPQERTQWYFQRYVKELPSGGEVVLFDRSWYNRAGVERVMGFCTEEEYNDFMLSCPEFERALTRSGIILVKYWLSVSYDEERRRLQERIDLPWKRWKISPMDLQAQSMWDAYGAAKDNMFKYTDTKFAPWYTVPSNDKPRARLNCISHLLSLVPYEDVEYDPLVLPERDPTHAVIRMEPDPDTFVPQKF